MTPKEGRDTMHNAAAFKMVEGRFSSHVKLFNSVRGVSDEDSDTQFTLYTERAALAKAALERAPKIQPSGGRVALLLSTDLGNVYRAIRGHLTAEELAKWDADGETLAALFDKYEG
jgi:hypothetical protein